MGSASFRFAWLYELKAGSSGQGTADTTQVAGRLGEDLATVPSEDRVAERVLEKQGFGGSFVEGFREQKALHLIALEGAQCTELVFGFDALGYDGEAEGVSHGDDVLDDSCVGLG